MQIPPELEKEITVINFPLPNRDDLNELLEKITEELEVFKHVKIELDDAGRERLLQAALGLTLGEAENVFARIIVKDERLDAKNISEVFAEKQQIIRKSGLLEYCTVTESFAQVGGLAALKEWLDETLRLRLRRRLDSSVYPLPKGFCCSVCKDAAKAFAPRLSPPNGSSRYCALTWGACLEV